MSMRDEAAVQNLCWAAMDFAHASKSLEEDEITLDEYNRVSARLEANKARLLALLAPEPEPSDAQMTRLAAILNACLHNVTIGATDRIYLRARLEDALALICRPPCDGVAITLAQEDAQRLWGYLNDLSAEEWECNSTPKAVTDQIRAALASARAARQTGGENAK